MIKETVISAFISMIRHDNGDVLVVRVANVEFRQKRVEKMSPVIYLFIIYFMLFNITPFEMLE